MIVAFMLMAIAMMIIPLPTWLLDILLVANISAALAIVLAASEESVKRVYAARHEFMRERGLMLRRHEARKHLHAPASDRHVVVAASKVHLAQLDDPYAPALGSVEW